MASARDTLEQQFLEMRWRVLSLAADLDRIERAEGGKHLLASDGRLAQFREAVQALLAGDGPDRAARVQMIFSDMTPPPARNPRSDSK